MYTRSITIAAACVLGLLALAGCKKPASTESTKQVVTLGQLEKISSSCNASSNVIACCQNYFFDKKNVDLCANLNSGNSKAKNLLPLFEGK